MTYEVISLALTIVILIVFSINVYFQIRLIQLRVKSDCDLYNVLSRLTRRVKKLEAQLNGNNNNK